MDKGEVSTLTLFVLSAAFDTIDYSTLTDRHSDWNEIEQYLICETIPIKLFEK